MKLLNTNKEKFWKKTILMSLVASLFAFGACNADDEAEDEHDHHGCEGDQYVTINADGAWHEIGMCEDSEEVHVWAEDLALGGAALVVSANNPNDTVSDDTAAADGIMMEFDAAVPDMAASYPGGSSDYQIGEMTVIDSSSKSASFGADIDPTSESNWCYDIHTHDSDKSHIILWSGDKCTTDAALYPASGDSSVDADWLAGYAEVEGNTFSGTETDAIVTKGVEGKYFYYKADSGVSGTIHLKEPRYEH